MSKQPKALQSKRSIARSKPLRKPAENQPQLPFDPMPQRIEPSLAQLRSKPPKGDRWSYEVKWDGYRIAVHIENGSVRILTRGGHDWTARFPKIATAAASLGVASAILDGEAVVLDDQGRSDFGALQKSLGGTGSQRASQEAIMLAFDLLYFDGHDLTLMELSSRRHILGEFLGRGDDAIKLSEDIEADGEALLAQACALGLEGIIAKDRDSTYRSGRNDDWIKIKCVQSDSFIIIGYEPGQTGLKSLLLAAYQDNELVYVGSVGTGFSISDAASLRKTLDYLKTNKPVVPLKRKDVVYAEPTLIAEIEYRGWTTDGKLRHASYKGLREQQDNSVIYKLGL